MIRGVENFLFEALCLLLITGIFSNLILKDKLSVEIRVIRGDTYRSTLNAQRSTLNAHATNLAQPALIAMWLLGGTHIPAMENKPVVSHGELGRGDVLG